MSAVYDNWERLVAATLRREWDRYLARCDSLSSASYSSASASFRSEASDSFLGYSFTYRQLLQATDGFNSVNILNRGQSGDFFRGYIRDKQILPQGSINTVIKAVDLRIEGNRKAYSSELNMLNTVPDASRVSPFLGLCWENEKIYMVYKYVSKRDLSRLLYQPVPDLDWKTKLKIAIGAAERLVYLHDECTPSLAHGDVQASSILVDDQFDVWLGSWSKVCTGNRNLTCPYDVYCFGKLLLHLVSGSLVVGSLAGETSKEEIEELLHNQELEDLQFSFSKILSSMGAEREEYMDRMDGLTYLRKPHHYDYKHLNNIGMGALLKEEEDFVEEILVVAFIAQACLNPISSKRPPMRKVLYHLTTPKAKIIAVLANR